jgi:hypothetical protein
MKAGDPFVGMSKAITATDIFAEARAFAGIRSAITATDIFAEARAFAGIRKAITATDIFAEARAFAGISKAIGAAMLGENGRLKGLLDVHRELHDRTAFSSIGHARAFAGRQSSVGQALGPIAALHERLATTYGPRFASKWDRGLPGALVPGVATLAALGGGAQPAAILASFSRASTAGTMLWLDERGDEAHVAVAATHPQVKPIKSNAEDQSLHLSVDVAVTCMLCDAKMLASGTQLAWTSNDKVLIKLAVFPLCATCTRRARENPKYWLKRLEDLSRPRIELVGSDGISDGIPRGKLRLVKREE